MNITLLRYRVYSVKALLLPQSVLPGEFVSRIETLRSTTLYDKHFKRIYICLEPRSRTLNTDSHPFIGRAASFSWSFSVARSRWCSEIAACRLSLYTLWARATSVNYSVVCGRLQASNNRIVTPKTKATCIPRPFCWFTHTHFARAIPPPISEECFVKQRRRIKTYIKSVVLCQI